MEVRPLEIIGGETGNPSAGGLISTKAAQNTRLDIEGLSEEELDRIKTRFERVARTARQESSAGRTDFIPRESRHDTAAVAQSNPGGRPGEAVRQPNEFDWDKKD